MAGAVGVRCGRRCRDGFVERLADDEGGRRHVGVVRRGVRDEGRRARTACPTRCSPTPRRRRAGDCGRSSPGPAARRTFRECSPPRPRCRCWACPCRRRHLSGQDSLYSIVQMPAGVPVATFAIGEAGAINAALFAVAHAGRRRRGVGGSARRLPGGPPRRSGRLGRSAAGDLSRTRGASRMSRRTVLPPATIGMMGGGQLGRYALIAARQMGYRTHRRRSRSVGTRRCGRRRAPRHRLRRPGDAATSDARLRRGDDRVRESARRRRSTISPIAV